MTKEQESQQTKNPEGQPQSLEVEVASQWKLMWWKDGTRTPSMGVL